jgi:phage terminase large subunit
LSPSEIARRLAVKPATVRSWKSRDEWEDSAATQRQEAQRCNETQQQRKRRTNKRIAREIDASPLTDKEKDFCIYYIQSYNGAQAAIRAGYRGSHGTMTSMAYKLLQKPKIRNLIDYLKQMKRETILAGVDDVIDLHMRIAFADMSGFVQWSNDGKRNGAFLMPSELVDGNLVKEISVTKDGAKIKLEDRQKSLDFLERYFLINPMDKHKQAYENSKLELEGRRIDAIVKSAEITSGSAAHTIIPDGVWRGLMNDAYAEFLTDDRPLQIFYGGASSGKSFGILGQRTIRDVMTGKRNYLIVRKTARTLRNSSFNEIRKCIVRMDLEGEFSINKTEMAITHKASGCQVLFAGLDDVEKVKSITPASGVLTDIVIEEATETDYNDFKQLQKRLRGGDESIIKRITLLFNPILQDHWIYEEFFLGKWDESKNYYGDDKQLILKTTYKDNRWLTPDDIAKLENETDRYYYEVYTLGNWGVLGNLIFTNWETRDLTELRKTWAKYHNGLDFGFFPDPTAFIRCGFDRAKKEVYIFQEFGGTGYTNDMIAEELKPIIGRELVTCDSAEPKSIQELNNFGIQAIPARKGPGSVEFGIKWLQKMKIYIDPSCVETINEIRKFKYQEDRNGNVLPKPVDRDNHYCSDALRYALEAEMVEVTVR